MVVKTPSRRRNESVEGGRVETMYSTVVGEGLRTRRVGGTVNIWQWLYASLVVP